MLSLFGTLLLGLTALTHASEDDLRPNVVVILVDDAGLTDFAPFGGEAQMPNIQTLADRGTKFSNYHTSPLCAPSRAMLLTGIDNHRTGIATIPEVLSKNQVDQPGYSMFFEPGVRTLADRVKAAGYGTYLISFGKSYLLGLLSNCPRRLKLPFPGRPDKNRNPAGCHEFSGDSDSVYSQSPGGDYYRDSRHHYSGCHYGASAN